MKNLEHVTKCLVRMGGELIQDGDGFALSRLVKVGQHTISLYKGSIGVFAYNTNGRRFVQLTSLLRWLLEGPGNMKIVKNGGKRVGDYGKGFSQMVNMSMTVRVWGEILPGGNVRYTLRTYDPDSCPTAVYPCPPRLGLDFLQGTIPANLIWDYFTDLGIPLPPGGCDD